MRTDYSDFAQKLHAAALEGGGWDGGLQAFAQATGSRSAQLCGIQADSLLFNVITNIDPAITAVLAQTAAQNPRVPIANRVPVLGTVVDGDFLTPDQHRRHPFYRQVCWAWDVPYICLTALQRADDMSVILAAVRSADNGHITRAQRSTFIKLARHVQSAVSMHLALERNGAALMAGALEALQCAALICDRRGYVRAMTPAAERLVSGDRGLSLRGRVLRARDETSIRLLLDAIRAAGEHRAVIDRFRVRTVRVAVDGGAAATVDVFALPEQPYELPFWPTVLIIIRAEGCQRDGTPPSDAQGAPQRQQLHTADRARAQRAESVLDVVAPAAFVLDGDGRVVHRNAAAESLLRGQGGLRLREQQLYVADPRIHGRLRALIASAAEPGGALLSEPSGAFALPRTPGKHSLQVMVLPLRLPGAFAAAHVLVLVGDPDQAPNFSEAVLGGLYGLTRAEVEIANALLSGRTVEQIAGERGVTDGTLRVQLKTIFHKTDTRRQSDLLKLLLSLPASSARTGRTAQA